MTRNPTPTWCVLSYAVQPPRFLCRRCGGEHVLTLPMDVRHAASMAFAFADLHAHCPPAPEEVKG